MKNNLKKLDGFTLIELMIIVVIITILSSIALVKYGPMSEKARSAEAYSALAHIVSAENAYKVEYDSYTTTIADLDIDAPVSQNFTFSIPSAAGTGYAQATQISGKATKNYCMCLKNSNQKSVASGSCNPGCN